jgi:hypothetical protein
MNACVYYLGFPAIFDGLFTSRVIFEVFGAVSMWIGAVGLWFRVVTKRRPNAEDQNLHFIKITFHGRGWYVLRMV